MAQLFSLGGIRSRIGKQQPTTKNMDYKILSKFILAFGLILICSGGFKFISNLPVSAKQTTEPLDNTLRGMMARTEQLGNDMDALGENQNRGINRGEAVKLVGGGLVTIFVAFAVMQSAKKPELIKPPTATTQAAETPNTAIKVEAKPDEQIIVVAPQFNLDEVTRTVGDLVFTNNQIIFAKTAGMTDVWALGVGAVGAAIITSVVSSQKSKEIQTNPLDVAMAASEPRNRYDYKSLESIEVKPSIWFTPQVIIRPRDGKRRKFWGKRKNLLKLVETTSQLVALGAPIRVV